MDDYTVYVQTDDQNRITAINSSAFLTDTTGWIELDSGTGDRYHHAQNHYLDKPLYTDAGIPRYKLENGRAVERSAAELAADIAALPPAEKTELELLREEVAQLKADRDALTIAILEGAV